MDCAVYRELVAAHVDGELEPRERQEAAAHLAGCPRCQQERALQDAVRTRVRGLSAPALPADVRARLMGKLERTRAGGRFGGRVARRRGIAAAAVAAAAAVVLLIGRGGGSSEVLAAAAVDYGEAEAGTLQIDWRTGDPADLEAYYHRRGVPAAMVKVMDLRKRGFALVGGSVRHRSRRAVAVTAYERDGRVLLCHRFVDGEFPAGGSVQGSRRVYERDGLTQAVVRDGSVMCCLTARMPPAEMVAALGGF